MDIRFGQESVRGLVPQGCHTDTFLLRKVPVRAIGKVPPHTVAAVPFLRLKGNAQLPEAGDQVQQVVVIQLSLRNHDVICFPVEIPRIQRINADLHLILILRTADAREGLLPRLHGSQQFHCPFILRRFQVRIVIHYIVHFIRVPRIFVAGAVDKREIGIPVPVGIGCHRIVRPVRDRQVSILNRHRQAFLLRDHFRQDNLRRRLQDVLPRRGRREGEGGQRQHGGQHKRQDTLMTRHMDHSFQP